MPAYKDEKTGKWFAKFYYTNWQGIKKQKWKRGFATKKEALGFERDFLEQQSANPDMTFQNLYEIYMEDMAARLKQSTLLTKKAVLQTHILPFFGSKPINEIKASDVRRWQAKLMSSPNNYSQTYLKKISTELNSIINYAKRFYDLNTNPCGKAGTIGKAKAEEMDYWTYDEYIAFREGVKDKPLSYICFEVLYWTGMREGELLALSPADIDLDNKTISINRTYQRIEGKDVFIIDDMISSGESMIDTARELKKRKANRIFVVSTFGLFTNGFASFDKAYEEGLIYRVVTTNLIYQSPELLSKEYYISCDMSKYIAYLIDTLNHDCSISDLLSPYDRIKKCVQKYNDEQAAAKNK